MSRNVKEIFLVAVHIATTVYDIQNEVALGASVYTDAVEMSIDDLSKAITYFEGEIDTTVDDYIKYQYTGRAKFDWDNECFKEIE